MEKYHNISNSPQICTIVLNDSDPKYIRAKWKRKNNKKGMINQQSNTSTYRKFIQKYIYSPLHKYIQHIEGDLKMEFLKRTITKLSFKLTFRKTCWMTHDAEQHNGYNIADLTDTVLLH